MSSTTTNASGFMGGLRMLGDSLFECVQDRMQLFAIELQEEKFRLIQIVIWISAVVFTGMMAAIFASITLVYLFWQSAPLATLGSLTVFYGLSLTAAILRLRFYLTRLSHPFAASIEELNEDRSCIRNTN